MSAADPSRCLGEHGRGCWGLSSMRSALSSLAARRRPAKVLVSRAAPSPSLSRRLLLVLCTGGGVRAAPMSCPGRELKDHVSLSAGRPARCWWRCLVREDPRRPAEPGWMCASGSSRVKAWGFLGFISERGQLMLKGARGGKINPEFYSGIIREAHNDFSRSFNWL